MTYTNFLTPSIKGRSIFSKVIPTVNTLQRLFTRLDEIGWATEQLKNWEKPIYKAYSIETLKPLLINQSKSKRENVIKNHLLITDTNELGKHPICIYLIAFYLQQSATPSLKDFKRFCVEKEISEQENSASAIWQVGVNDGKYLNLFNENLEILDLNYFIQWSKHFNKIKSPSIEINNNIPNQIIEHKRSHLDFFLQLPNENNIFKGPNSLKWAVYVCGSKYEYPEIFNQNFYRDDLLDFCNSECNSDLLVLLAILSWGGMRRDHGRKLLQNPKEILDIVNKLRNNYFKTRQEAFEYIQVRRKQNLLQGLGIGYFTKLICFLAPNLNAYIMDQWLGKSINLIFEENLIHLSNDWVSDKNNSIDYENFCNKIDYLGSLINLSGYKTEEKLFSVGGHKKGIWRQYVVENYK